MMAPYQGKANVAYSEEREAINDPQTRSRSRGHLVSLLGRELAAGAAGCQLSEAAFFSRLHLALLAVGQQWNVVAESTSSKSQQPCWQ